jgi:ABC-type phosphate transport system ATPase subunit
MSVEFRDVAKRYGAATAVAGISFTVESGTLVTLLGPSGCGKTTTLRMIAGLELPSEGRILIAGRDVTNLNATQRDVSMVFQSYALFPHMSVLENVCYGLRRSGLAKAIADARAREGLAQVGLEDTKAASRRNSRAASSSAWRWRAPWCWNRLCCCSTSRSATSMRGCGARCARRSASCNSGFTLPWSTSRTTSRRRWRCRTVSS